MKNTRTLLSSLLLISILISCNISPDKFKTIGYQRPARPNILWISCEDMSPRLGCYGDEVANTPNIDQLAMEGRRYTNVYTSAPVCAPCRAGIITGMYQTSIGAQHMRTSHKGEGLPTPYEAVPPHYVKTFTEYLRANGYYCTNNKKTDYQFGNPFTVWDECGQDAHYTHRVDTSQPFFAVFNFTITHESQTWGMPDSTDPSSVKVPPYYPDIPEARNTIARQYDNIALLDQQVGHILKELEKNGYGENTVVFFWSDHGDGLPRAKRWPYDSGTKVPLIIKWPKQLIPESVDERLISSIDFGPTVLSIAGINVPANMEGRAFLGDFIAPEHDFVVSARDRFDESYDMVRSIRNKRYRYVRNFYPNLPYVLHIPYRDNSPFMQAMLDMHAAGTLKGIPANWFKAYRPAEELFDCKTDPHNIHNLASLPKYHKELCEMRKQLDRWMLKTGDKGRLSEEEMVESMWPGRLQPITEKPKLVLNTPENPMRELKEAEGDGLKVPAELRFYCPTQGASIGYTFDTLTKPHWKLYSGPIQLEKGVTKIRAKAIRYGYRESEEVIESLLVQ